MFLRACFAALVGSLAAACDAGREGGDRADAGAPDAGRGAAVIDPNIQQAVQAAAASASASARAADGPPPNGVFRAGEADKAFSPTAPPKVEILAEGSEPRVVVAPKLDAEGAQTLRLVVNRGSGNQQQPGLEYTLAVKVEIPGKKPGTVEAAASAAPEASPPELVLGVRAVDIIEAHRSRVPAELAKKIAKLKGSSLRMPLAPDGAAGEPVITLAKGADAEVGSVLAGLVELAPLLFWPAPDKPLGAGALFLVTDRATAVGVPVVRYRAIRVEDVRDGEARMSMDLKMYVADAGAVPPDFGAEDALVVAFEAAGKATWTRKPGALVPASGELQLPLTFVLAARQNPQMGRPVQIKTVARVLAAADGEAKP
jgi:hypothetical protein